MLAWPAMFRPAMSYPALPAISGFLKARGVDCRIHDLNLLYISSSLKRKYLKKRGIVLNKKIKTAAASRSKYLLKEYLTAADLLKVVLREIDGAVYVLKNFSPKDPRHRYQVQHAVHIINAASYIISTSFTNTASLFTTIDFYQGLFAQNDRGTIQDFIRRAEDKDNNPFREFLDTWVGGLPRSNRRYVFGISLTGYYQVLFTYTLAYRLKRKFPDSFVVIGGAYVPYFTDRLPMRGKRNHYFKYVDAYITGSGEYPMLHLIQRIEEDGDIKNIPGTTVRVKNRYHTNANTQQFILPKEFPIPDYSYIKKDMLLIKDYQYSVELSRGCYWGKCAFCANTRGANSKFTPSAVPVIIRSIKHLKRTLGARHIIFSTLAAQPDLLKRVCDEIVGQGMDIEWGSFVRMDTLLKEDHIRSFKKAGCSHLALSAENLDKKVLKRMNKGYDASYIKKLVPLLKKHKLLSALNIIIGFPGEPVGNIRRTIEYARKNKLLLNIYQLFVPKLSLMAKEPGKFDIILTGTREMRSDYDYEYTRRDHREIADRVINEYMKRYPGNIYRLPFTTYIIANFSYKKDASVVHRSRRNLSLYKPTIYPQILPRRTGFRSFEHYYIGDLRTLAFYPTSALWYRFLTLCSGERTLNSIASRIGNNEAAFQIFFKAMDLNFIY